MKKITITLLFILISSFLQSQENKVLKLDFNSSTIKRFNPSIEFYKINNKKLTYNRYKRGKVMTTPYKNGLENLKKYEKGYLEYENKVDSVQKLKKSINKIQLLCNDFLKPELNTYNKDKEKYLIEAQSIADSENLKIEVPNISIFGKNKGTKELFLYKKGKSIRGKNVREYSIKLSRLKIETPIKTDEYKEYLKAKRNLPLTKYKQGLIPLEETYEKEVLLIENPKGQYIADFEEGSYEIYTDKYVVSLVEIEGIVKEYEVLKLQRDTYRDFDRSEITSKKYLLLKNLKTNKYYCLDTSLDNIKSIISNQNKSNKNEEIVNFAKSKGYNVEVNGEYAYIITKLSKINLNEYTYNELKSKPNYVEKIDSDHLKVIQLTKQSKSISKKLDNYIQLYNAKGKLTPTNTINSWKAQTVKANKLNVKLNEINSKYNEDIMLLNKNTLYDLDDFLSNLIASKNFFNL